MFARLTKTGNRGFASCCNEAHTGVLSCGVGLERAGLTRRWCRVAKWYAAPRATLGARNRDNRGAVAAGYLDALREAAADLAAFSAVLDMELGFSGRERVRLRTQHVSA